MHVDAPSLKLPMPCLEVKYGLRRASDDPSSKRANAHRPTAEARWVDANIPECRLYRISDHLNPSGSAESRPDLASHPGLDSFPASRAQTNAICVVLEASTLPTVLFSSSVITHYKFFVMLRRKRRNDLLGIPLNDFERLK